MRDAVELFEPSVFLSVHSGVFLVTYPYAYEAREPEHNGEALKKVAEMVNERYVHGP